MVGLLVYLQSQCCEAPSALMTSTTIVDIINIRRASCYTRSLFILAKRRDKALRSREKQHRLYMNATLPEGGVPMNHEIIARHARLVELGRRPCVVACGKGNTLFHHVWVQRLPNRHCLTGHSQYAQRRQAPKDTSRQGPDAVSVQDSDGVHRNVCGRQQGSGSGRLNK